MRSSRLRWWREVVTILVVYQAYSLVRNTQGSGSTTATHAYRNARAVVRFEEAIGLFHEETVQQLFLHSRPS